MQLTKSTSISAACSTKVTSSPSFSFSITKLTPTKGRLAPARRRARTTRRMFSWTVAGRLRAGPAVGVGPCGVDADVELVRPQATSSAAAASSSTSVAVDADLGPGNRAREWRTISKNCPWSSASPKPFSESVERVRELLEHALVRSRVDAPQRVGRSPWERRHWTRGEVAPVVSSISIPVGWLLITTGRSRRSASAAGSLRRPRVQEVRRRRSPDLADALAKVAEEAGGPRSRADLSPAAGAFTESISPVSVDCNASPGTARGRVVRRESRSETIGMTGGFSADP